jgi:hypothetical protein
MWSLIQEIYLFRVLAHFSPDSASLKLQQVCFRKEKASTVSQDLANHCFPPSKKTETDNTGGILSLHEVSTFASTLKWQDFFIHAVWPKCIKRKAIYLLLFFFPF